jgi:hypothetical protein
VNWVCVVNGVCEGGAVGCPMCAPSVVGAVDVVADGFAGFSFGAGNAWIPSACASFECVRKAKGALEPLLSASALVGEVDVLNSCF